MSAQEPAATEAVARELAARRHGVVARRELRAAGLSEDLMTHMCRSGRWCRLSDEVLMLRGAPVSQSADIVAAVLDAGPDARLSDDSAAFLWGLKGCRLQPFVVCRTSSTRRRCRLAVVRRVRRLPAAWCTELDGVPIIRPELLAVRLFALHHPQRAATLVDRLWSMRLLSGPSLATFLTDMGARGRNGTAGLRAYLHQRGPDYVPSASNLESRVRQLLATDGIDLRAQVDSGGGGWTGRVDFRHEVLPLIVEVQSEAHHSALVDRAADARRLASLRAAGFAVVEVWDTTVWSDPAAALQTVRDGIRRAQRLVANAGP
jgi:very-short-patch-repair endonuclease